MTTGSPTRDSGALPPAFVFGGSTSRLIVVDTSPMPDFETALRQRLTMWHRDANAAFNAELTERLVACCEALQYRYLFKDDFVAARNEARARAGEPPLSLGSTELGRIVAASNGLVDGTTMQVPTCGYHTMSEPAPRSSVKAFLEVLRHLSSESAVAG